MQHVNAALIDCQFTVDSTSASGISSLKGGLVPAVYMHSGSPSASNPNPAAGYAIVQLGDNFNGLYECTAQIQSPNSGSNLLVASAGLTVGLVYVITVLGTTTTANWHALGVPAGVTPAVGVAFVAQLTSTTGTGAVQVPATAGSAVDSIEIAGNPNVTLASSNPAQGAGYYPYIVFRFMANLAIATPADGTIVRLGMLLSNSSVQVGGW